eukprot:3812840-Rhodomonas_salina.4
MSASGVADWQHVTSSSAACNWYLEHVCHRWSHPTPRNDPPGSRNGYVSTGNCKEKYKMLPVPHGQGLSQTWLLRSGIGFVFFPLARFRLVFDSNFDVVAEDLRLGEVRDCHLEDLVVSVDGFDIVNVCDRWRLILPVQSAMLGSYEVSWTSDIRFSSARTQEDSAAHLEMDVLSPREMLASTKRRPVSSKYKLKS